MQNKTDLIEFAAVTNSVAERCAKIRTLKIRINRPAAPGDAGAANEITIARKLIQKLTKDVDRDIKETLAPMYQRWRDAMLAKITNLRREMESVADDATKIIRVSTALDALCLSRLMRDEIDALARAEMKMNYAVGEARKQQCRKNARRFGE